MGKRYSEIEWSHDACYTEIDIENLVVNCKCSVFTSDEVMIVTDAKNLGGLSYQKLSDYSCIVVIFLCGLYLPATILASVIAYC